MKQLEEMTHERKVPIGISARHVHLSEQDLEVLFGKGAKLTPYKPLSQPGQFASVECVDIITSRGMLRGVRILGPVRKETQVEISKTDCYTLGLDAPVRASGDIEGTPGAILRGPEGILQIPKGVIIPDRHIHMTPEDAAQYGVKNGDRVHVLVEGERGGILDRVLIRVSETSRLDFHVDTDDANAFDLHQGQWVRIFKSNPYEK